jgi:hypothetical protein
MSVFFRLIVIRSRTSHYVNDGPIGDIHAWDRFYFASGLSVDAVGRTNWKSALLLPSDDAVS